MEWKPLPVGIDDSFHTSPPFWKNSEYEYAEIFF